MPSIVTLVKVVRCPLMTVTPAAADLSPDLRGDERLRTAVEHRQILNLLAADIQGDLGVGGLYGQVTPP